MRAPEFWRRDGAISRLLTPAGWIYGLARCCRNVFSRTPLEVSVPVICIGNLVAGGAGKTPVALDLGKRISGKGKAIHFLSRGYGGSERGPVCVDPSRHDAGDVGDEPLLLAGTSPTWVSVDRPAGCLAAVAAGAEVIIMDDGFQNPSVRKDLSLLVVDGGYGLGNGRMMPAGPLREPPDHALKRADAVVIIGDDETNFAAMASAAGVKILNVKTRPDPGTERLAGCAVVAFAGIGRPENFFRTLEGLGCELRATHAYPDHFPYREEKIEGLRAQARRENAVLVTTEKDVVRIDPEAREGIEVLTITLHWEDEMALEAVLRPAMD
jgi:tetraacyldisaccharide 4'-kinase